MGGPAIRAQGGSSWAWKTHGSMTSRTNEEWIDWLEQSLAETRDELDETLERVQELERRLEEITNSPLWRLDRQIAHARERDRSARHRSKTTVPPGASECAGRFPSFVIGDGSLTS